MSKTLQTPDSVYLPSISEEQIELEHRLHFISDQDYESLVKGYVEAYDIDGDEFDLALGIRGIDDFYQDYYLSSLLNGKENFTHNELQMLNQLEQLQQEILDRMDKMNKLEAISDSLGLKEKYQECVDRLETRIHLELMSSLGMDLDS